MPSTIIEYVICAQCEVREAAVFMRRSVAEPSSLGGRSQSGGDLALCAECAAARGISASRGKLELSIEDILDAAIGLASGNEDAGIESEPIRCPNCGNPRSALVGEGRLGCPACAIVFAKSLSTLVLRRPRSSSPDRMEKPILLPDIPGQSPIISGLSIRDVLTPRPLGGPDSDIVISTTARLSRCSASFAFPGSPIGGAAPFRKTAATILSELPGWRVIAMGDLDRSTRRAIVESGFAPSSWVADSASTAALDPRASLVLLVDETDHVRLVARKPGLELETAFATVASALLDLDEHFPEWAHSDALGWICSRVEECGNALHVAVQLHLPALVIRGLTDRLLKGLLSRGIAVHGIFPEPGALPGALFDLALGPDSGASRGEMVEILKTAVLAAASAEREARIKLGDKDSEMILDRTGRAWGVASNCRLLSQTEGAGIASDLRLAFLLDYLRPVPGGSPPEFSTFLDGMGPGRLASFEGRTEPWQGEEALRARARAFNFLASSCALTDGGSRCSRA